MRVLTAIVCLALCACNAATNLTTATSTTAPSATTTVLLSPEEATERFELCLSGYGVEAEIPVNDEGRPDLAALQDSLREDLTTLREALTTCAVFLAASGALDFSGEPVLGEAVRTQLTNFSVCMRSQGVDDFPDPDQEFDGTDLPYPMADLPVDDPEFGQAIDACAAAVGVDPLRR